MNLERSVVETICIVATNMSQLFCVLSVNLPELMFYKIVVLVRFGKQASCSVCPHLSPIGTEKLRWGNPRITFLLSSCDFYWRMFFCMVSLFLILSTFSFNLLTLTYESAGFHSNSLISGICPPWSTWGNISISWRLTEDADGNPIIYCE